MSENVSTPLTGISKLDFEPIFECDKCKDLGYINVNSKSEICSCFKQRIINEAYKQAKWFSITFANFFPLKIIKFIAGTCTFCIEKHEKGVISSKIKKKEKIKKILENFENEKNLEKTQKLSKISAGIPYVDKFVSLKKYLDSMHDRNRLDRNEAVTINSLSLSNSQNKYKEKYA